MLPAKHSCSVLEVCSGLLFGSLEGRDFLQVVVISSRLPPLLRLIGVESIGCRHRYR